MRPQHLDFTCRQSVESLLMRSSTGSNTGDIPQSDQNGGQPPLCMNPSDYEELRKLPGNERCVDCDNPDPDWASISLGIFVCLQCSGRHRALGTHVSKVRSVRLDAWTEEQVALMRCGGNNQCRNFLEKHGYGIDLEIADRYDSAPGMLYQRTLMARREGAPEPTELPAYVPPPKVNRQSSANSTTGGASIINPTLNSNMQGFGSDVSNHNNGNGGSLAASWSRLTSQ